MAMIIIPREIQVAMQYAFSAVFPGLLPHQETTFALSISILILLLAITLFSSVKSQKTNRLPLPPGPKPWPLVGCLPLMLTNKPAFRWIHNLMHEMNTEIACIRLGNVYVIPVTCPEISREFLKQQDAVFASRPLTMSTELISRGYMATILTPLGEQWKKMKKVFVAEMLSPAKHKWFYHRRLEEADYLVRYVYNQCNKSKEGGLVDVRVASQHYCGSLTRNMVFNKRIFGEGMKDGGPGSEDKEHINAIFTVLAYLYSFCVSDYMPCLIGLDLDGHEKIMNNAIEIINKYHDPIIEERIQQWRNGIKQEADDLLDVLINLKDSYGKDLLSTEEIKAQINEIMIAAVDNPSNAVEWGLAEMINQPEILEKAVEELDRVVGKEKLVQESDFPQLKYITACAREAFRLHPMAPFNPPHVSLADTTVANYFIPKGSHVLLSRVGLGRNPKIWDEPLKFNPERHLREEGSNKISLTEPDLRFISFSTGKRGCPGIVFGTSMTLMLFARLIQGFSWNVPHNEIKIDVTECKNGLALAKPLVALAKPRLAAYLYPA